jgi:hypothetical protein
MAEAANTYRSLQARQPGILEEIELLKDKIPGDFYDTFAGAFDGAQMWEKSSVGWRFSARNSLITLR